MENFAVTGERARKASYCLAQCSSGMKNDMLQRASQYLMDNARQILDANGLDMESANREGIRGAMLDRLLLTVERVQGMAGGLSEIALLHDPVGEVLGMHRRPNGLLIGKKRVPFGVIGVIYEARPNVTADVFGLCLKTGNAVILRGGKEALHSNIAITEVLRQALGDSGLPPDSIQLIRDTSRESTLKMMKGKGILDLLIPRGGAGLIQAVVENSNVPVIETGVGNCHIYIDQGADPQKARNIVVNAKTQRPGVCNAAESLLIHRDVPAEVVKDIAAALLSKGVEIRGDSTICSLVPEARPAGAEDWGTEYLDLIIAARIVDSLDQAVDHIRVYGTGHSEAIITEDYSRAQRFLELVDAAAVYVNASTRFTDGFEFGMGAEVGISTQKLHARGPMGLNELTSTKYIVYGNGQVRG